MSDVTWRAWAKRSLRRGQICLILGSALADADYAIKDAREIGQAATLLFALGVSSLAHIFCGNYSVANAKRDEVVALADEKGAPFMKAAAMVVRGCLLALTGKAADAVHMITSGITALRSTGATLWMPLWVSHLARAYAELCQFDDASRHIGEAMTTVETTK